MKCSSLNEIRKTIEKSENPLIIFDGDPDGLVSYLLIRKFFGKGEGIVAKGHLLEEGILDKIKEYSADLIIIVDIPVVDQVFVDLMKPGIVYIDHHGIQKLKGLKHYFNPKFKNKNYPTSYCCWELVKKNFLWLATVGVVADWSLANFKEFKKEYPDLVKTVKVDNPAEVLFNSDIGKLSRIFSFILKGKPKDVMKLVKLLLKIEEPYEILEQKNESGMKIFKKAEKIKKIYDSLLKDALKVRGRLLIFKYYSIVSLSSDLANELVYRRPKSIVVVAKEKESEYSMSIRSSENDVKLPKILNKIVNKIPDSFGGGHDHAGGLSIKKEYFDEFVDILKKEI